MKYHLVWDQAVGLYQMKSNEISFSVGSGSWALPNENIYPSRKLIRICNFLDQN